MGIKQQGMKNCKCERCGIELIGVHNGTKRCDTCQKEYRKEYHKNYEKEYQKSDKYKESRKKY